MNLNKKNKLASVYIDDVGIPVCPRCQVSLLTFYRGIWRRRLYLSTALGDSIHNLTSLPRSSVVVLLYLRERFEGNGWLWDDVVGILSFPCRRETNASRGRIKRTDWAIFYFGYFDIQKVQGRYQREDHKESHIAPAGLWGIWRGLGSRGTVGYGEVYPTSFFYFRTSKFENWKLEIINSLLQLHHMINWMLS